MTISKILERYWEEFMQWWDAPLDDSDCIYYTGKKMK